METMEDRAIKALQSGVDWLEMIDGTKFKESYNREREKVSTCMVLVETIFQKKLAVKDGKVMWAEED